MARFYGTVQGNRGEATRLGHSSMHVTAQSWTGDITVRLSDVAGVDYASINVREHGGGRASKNIYWGPISKLLDQSQRKTLLHALALEELTE